MLNLRVDSGSRALFVEVLPAGEKEPIAFEVHDYAFVTENGATYLAFGRLKASRRWLESVAEAVFPDKRIPLPGGLPAGLLRTVME